MNPTHELEIKDILSKLPSKTSSGFDAISNKLLKDLTSSITHPLSIIYNKSLLEGTFPSRMKLAITVPLYKGKEKFLVNNYRPISLLLTLSKILEKLMYKRTYGHLEKMNSYIKANTAFVATTPVNMQ